MFPNIPLSSAKFFKTKLNYSGGRWTVNTRNKDLYFDKFILLVDIFQFQFQNQSQSQFQPVTLPKRLVTSWVEVEIEIDFEIEKCQLLLIVG